MLLLRSGDKTTITLSALKSERIVIVDHTEVEHGTRSLVHRREIKEIWLQKRRAQLKIAPEQMSLYRKLLLQACYSSLNKK